ncbi:STAS domain-containing protein [Pseudonocardia sp. KRD-184]|uniref:STAS domain-containing protein n=1 Tax=Pseudonocardia oceani TaxID=2792013 RepID=A0ABS6U4M9_9PSEU|nr:STAS domain-containing protein [Pseudonocardia oceani]MBW0092252.1 STAS domain-containing protein [Pseudonocardia oceani]MBW0099233.1 STAS domain-containing protein [Pseudonocardia oceani]MBW0108420.1 STAS domain-containing protein [Pseudonocardia oceani]MBW0125392.1 STAS domain-containing protein [Pseudonocardia oceani]MBW0126941.1 STAS domain-containing protein [Pseudonocardia oceani]
MHHHHATATGLAVTATRPASGLAVVRVRGELDRDTEPYFTRCLQTLLDAATEVVVVDLAEVTFLAARGVDAVVEGATRAGAQEVALRLVGRRSDAVVRAFSAAGALDLLDPEPDADDVLRALLPGRGEDGGSP